ncbi:MAG: hypothetical protein WCH04_15350, partial [Gammaproteobacteria bacterium]
QCAGMGAKVLKPSGGVEVDPMTRRVGCDASRSFSHRWLPIEVQLQNVRKQYKHDMKTKTLDDWDGSVPVLHPQNRRFAAPMSRYSFFPVIQHKLIF